jgi:hypothetical protein
MSTDPCEKVKEVDLQIKGLTQTRRVELQECNKSKYLPPSDQPSTMIELIQYIYENQEELKDCNKLFEKFPEINERPVGGLSKPYIFEALWKIIFLLYLDNLTPTDYSRVFKKSIEGNKTIGRVDGISRVETGNVMTAAVLTRKFKSPAPVPALGKWSTKSA